MSNILYCDSCKKYTLEETCPNCHSKTNTVKPAKFSIDDKWGKWRRIYKKEQTL